MIRCIRICGAAMLALALAACGGGSKVEPVSFVPVGSVYEELYGGWPAGSYLIRNQLELQAAWNSFELWRSLRPPVLSLT